MFTLIVFFFFFIGDMLGPPLPDVPLLSPSMDPTVNPHPTPDFKEKKNSAKKKCLFNYQDAFMEASEGVMATSSALSSVSSTTTTVQSSKDHFTFKILFLIYLINYNYIWTVKPKTISLLLLQIYFSLYFSFLIFNLSSLCFFR